MSHSVYIFSSEFHVPNTLKINVFSSFSALDPETYLCVQTVQYFGRVTYIETGIRVATSKR